MTTGLSLIATTNILDRKVSADPHTVCRFSTLVAELEESFIYEPPNRSPGTQIS